jgi:hypothetical protein
VSATFLYVAPEVRLGRRFGENFEINVGVEFLVMAALKQRHAGQMDFSKASALVKERLS